jgi:hypothetical protein
MTGNRQASSEPGTLQPLPSRRSATLKELAQIANLVYPDQHPALREFEKSREIHPPDKAKLLAIRRRRTTERISDLRKQEILNPGLYSRNPSERAKLKSEIDRITSIGHAWQRPDQKGFDYAANNKYWQEMVGYYEDKRSEQSDRDAKKAQELAGDAERTFLLAARQATKWLWPELWEDESQAPDALRPFRNLLQAFWRETDKRARHWYIYQAHLYYWRFIIQRQHSAERKEAQQKLLSAETRNEREEAFNWLSWLQSEIDLALFNPPAGSPFEDALFKLPQLRRSRAPHICENPKCPHPYFLKSKSRRKYCSENCFHENDRAKGRADWHNKYSQRRKKHG